MRTLFFRALAAGLGLTFLGLVLELGLRLLPVSDGTNSVEVTAMDPVLRFEPNRSFVWSRGWRFQLVNRVRSNNYGFISEIDFDPDDGSPLVAVIGDSFIEAIMVPYEETGQAHLARHLEGSARVYAFASSGSPLSQYLAYTEFARQEFRPDRLVIVVVSNDFDESWYRYRPRPGFHYFFPNEAGQELRLVEHRATLLKRLARRSALARYLVQNLEVGALPERIRQRLSGAEFAGNTRIDTDPTRLADSRRAVSAFFEELPRRSGLAPEHIAFVVDAVRPDLYDDEARGRAGATFAGVMLHEFVAIARDRGYRAIDLEPIFLERYRRTGERFEYPTDNHWNPNGHRVFAEAVMDSGFLAELAKFSAKDAD